MAIFTGAGVAIITPFHEDGSINYDQLKKLVDYHCENGTDSIVICGTTGESATMTEEEHLECIKRTIDFTAGRIPVIAGTGSNCTATAVELSREAAKAGADGLLVVTPYYNKATQKGLIEHYKAIAREADAPIIMYSVASRTGCNIEPATVAALVKEVDNIVGVKEASGNISQVAKIMQLTPGDIAGSRELQLKAIPLINALFSEVNPIPVKKAVSLMGMEAGGLRMPLTEMEEANAQKLAQAMRAFGIQLA